MKNEHAQPSVAIKKCTEFLNEYMIPLVPQMTIGDGEQTKKAQKLLNDLIASNAEFMTLYTKIESNIKASA